jgi:hypothetical protein
VSDFPFNMSSPISGFRVTTSMRLNAVIAILAVALALIAIGLFSRGIRTP